MLSEWVLRVPIPARLYPPILHAPAGALFCRGSGRKILLSLCTAAPLDSARAMISELSSQATEWAPSDGACGLHLLRNNRTTINVNV